MTNVPYPDMSVQVAFNANPNSSDNPLWTDLSQMVTGGDAFTMGKLYELLQTQASTPTLTFRDPYELLNPLNPASPWQAGLVPYRGICCQATDGRGETGNLLGNDQWNIQFHFDPTFESYAVGSFPTGMSQFGPIGAHVTNSDSHGGSQSLVFTPVGGGASFQAVGVPFLCIPGRAYTASVWVHQTATTTNTAGLFLFGHGYMDSTTVAGSYTRLVGTFIADQPQLVLGIGYNTTPSASGTIFIDEVQIEPATALNANPGFELGLAGWSLTGGGRMTVDTGWFRSGSHSLKMTPDGVTGTVFCEADMVPVTAGARYLISAQGWSATGTGSTPVGTRVDWYNSSRGFISTSTTALSPLAAGVQNLYSSTETAPAGAAFAGVHVLMTGTPAASNVVQWDEVQIVPVSASTFTTSGPAVYPWFRGMVERWPRTWQSNGFEGYCQAQLVDGMAAWNKTEMHTELAAAILDKAPDWYWRLNEPVGSTVFTDTSGHANTPLTQTRGTFGPADVFFAGANTGIAGDIGQTGLQTYSNNQGSFTCSPVETGLRTNSSVVAGGVTLPIGVTISVVASHLGSFSAGPGYAVTVFDQSERQFAFGIGGVNSGGDKIAAVFNQLNTPGSACNAIATDTWSDGLPHLYTATLTVSAANLITVTLFVDGTQVATGSVTATLKLPLVATIVLVGGAIDPTGTAFGDSCGLPQGIYSHVAGWNRALASSEIQDVSRGRLGYLGELFDARITRCLQRGPYVTNTNNIPANRLSVTGASTLSAPNMPERTSLFTAVSNAVLAEMGNVWIAADGATTAESRSDRFFRTGATWILGEDISQGEVPYTDQIAFDTDPVYIYGDVQAQRTFGGMFVGGRPADVAATQAKYFGGAYQPPGTLDLATDGQAQDYVDWTFYSHNTPATRARAVTIDPMANPSLWQAVFRFSPGMRVTVRRRPQGLSGPVFGQDFFVEQISHNGINFDISTGLPLSWKTTLYLSPITTQNSPWILGDPNRSVLGSTTIPGF